MVRKGHEARWGLDPFALDASSEAKGYCLHLDSDWSGFFARPADCLTETVQVHAILLEQDPGNATALEETADDDVSCADMVGRLDPHIL